MRIPSPSSLSARKRDLPRQIGHEFSKTGARISTTPLRSSLMADVNAATAPVRSYRDLRAKGRARGVVNHYGFHAGSTNAVAYPRGSVAPVAALISSNVPDARATSHTPSDDQVRDSSSYDRPAGVT